ncbi:MAG TPA: 7-carboxy-7-deazaguanine synthase QueE [Verrucomicrobiae bacterium]|nr:7-carboxy-7-deazaguanine synthase QueE [Verrucomicrobiae bacterium]
MMQTSLVEVMSSIQGEALYVGCRQVFVRFLGCNLACPYCDTPASFTQVRECRVEKTPGKRDFITLPNPMDPQDVVKILGYYDLRKHHSISFTGGEPLLQADFLQRLLPLLKNKGPLIFLETNGTLPGELAKIIDLVDIISMDFKLWDKVNWAAHEEFLRVASQKTVYVKVVVLPDTQGTEIETTARLISSINPNIPLILQPVTPYGRIRKGPLPEKMIEFQDLALDYLSDVRVIPQTHKIMGQL